MTVIEFMSKSGCDMSSKTYEYLKTALEIAVENPSMSIGMVFTNTAKERGKTYNAISKGVEKLVANGFPNMDEELKKYLFGEKASITTGKYIVAVSCAIRNGLI